MNQGGFRCVGVRLSVTKALMRSLLFLTCMLAAGEAAAQECVVLLPGVGQSTLSTMLLRHRLERDGYYVWNKGYSPTTRPIEESAQDLGKAMDDCIRHSARPVNFVTHSMGGLLVRAYFQDHSTENAGRVVMLGPPNHGSDLVDRIQNRWWYRFITGPAGQELVTDPVSVPNRLKPITLEVGVITSHRDHKVTVANARLDEMKDFLVMDCSHPVMPYSKVVYQQVLAFLKTGRFEKTQETSTAEQADLK